MVEARIARRRHLVGHDWRTGRRSRGYRWPALADAGPPSAAAPSWLLMWRSGYTLAVSEYLEATVPLYVRDDEVRRMAQRLAAARKSTVTEAVRRALARELAEIDSERAEREGALRRLFAVFDAAAPGAAFGDDEMYDEDGLPR